MALKGRAGQRFSHAPHPMQRSMLMAGMRGERLFPSSELTICIAPVGQWRAQFPQFTPSVMETQFFMINTAWPTWVEDFCSRVIGRMAPVGHTSEHFVHSGRQYPRSYDISGCISRSSLVEGESTPFGHADTHNWQAVQCWSKLRALNEPGGTRCV